MPPSCEDSFQRQPFDFRDSPVLDRLDERDVFPCLLRQQGFKIGLGCALILSSRAFDGLTYVHFFMIFFDIMLNKLISASVLDKRLLIFVIFHREILNDSNASRIVSHEFLNL